MALFSSGDKPKKPSFFQRVREAITGSPASTEPQPAEAAIPATSQSTPEAKPSSDPPFTSPVLIDDLVPRSEEELAEVEGVETPAAPASLTTIGTSFAAELASFDEPIAAELSPAAASTTPAIAAAHRDAPPQPERNEFGLRPMNTNFSFGGYASAEEEDNYYLQAMREAVSRTRDQFTTSLDSVLSLTRTVDEETFDELESVLLTADLGMTTTQEILGNLRTRALRERANGTELKQMLREQLRAILNEVEQPTNHPSTGPEVIMMVGVNGTGKTTTSGKLAALYGTHGRKALLCAADTFRAAAIEQLEVWAKRSNVDIIKTKQGGDPSAALYDALTAGRARKADIVIVDTAGRLHNKAGLMAELDKMRRTAQKLVPGAPHQTFLVMDATTGQNGMQQARLFLEASRVTGIVLTKLDGTAKGGIVIAIARELRLPVVFVGVGEKMTDILPFDGDNFIDSLLGA